MKNEMSYHHFAVVMTINIHHVFCWVNTRINSITCLRIRRQGKTNHNLICLYYDDIISIVENYIDVNQ